MVTTLKKQFDKVIEVPFIYKLYALASQSRRPLRLTYHTEDFTSEYYAKVKNLKLRELEHQIGRLSNFQKIVQECASLEGDFIEFGSWKGFSLLWTAYFMERNAIFNRKLIGLDGFIGLPYTDGIFRKGKFANTSLKECRQNIMQSPELYDEIKKNIYVEKFMYSEKQSMLAYLKQHNAQKFCFVHIDCDVSKSAEEIFDLLVEGDLLADKAYILYDDYGIEPRLREVVEAFNKKQNKKWDIKVHSETDLTKNYIFTRKK